MGWAWVFGGVVGHIGDLAGYNTALAYDPQRDIVVVALNNGTPPPGDHPASREVKDVLYTLYSVAQEG